MSEYYCLMAGVPDLQASDPKPPFTVAQFREQCDEVLTEKDKKLLAKYYYQRYDCLNVVALLQNPDEPRLNTGGSVGVDELREFISSVRESVQQVESYPRYLTKIVWQWDKRRNEEGYFPEDEALYGFYRWAIDTCPNAFIRKWYDLNLNIANILTALLAREHGWDIGKSIMGEGETQETIRKSNTSDFGLLHILDYMPQLMEIAKESDPEKKERMTDAMKWAWLEENSFFKPFGIESVFAYLCKLAILERWSKLDAEQGKQKFEQIIDNLRGAARVPAEFA